jgi:signal transduction histidine kinase
MIPANGTSLMPDDTFARLVSLACHDLRTPLATVYGFARTLTKGEALDEPEAGYAKMIEAASSQIRELLDELGLAARIEAGRYQPRLAETDTAALARAAAERLGSERVAVSGPGGTVRVDVEATERAVSALVQSALRHGGLDDVSVVADGPALRISPVTAASGPVVLGEELRDLGAAVAAKLVETLGGSLELEDETLTIRLPA